MMHHVSPVPAGLPPPAAAAVALLALCLLAAGAQALICPLDDATLARVRTRSSAARSTMSSQPEADHTSIVTTVRLGCRAGQGPGPGARSSSPSPAGPSTTSTSGSRTSRSGAGTEAFIFVSQARRATASTAARRGSSRSTRAGSAAAERPRAAGSRPTRTGGTSARSERAVRLRPPRPSPRPAPLRGRSRSSPASRRPPGPAGPKPAITITGTGFGSPWFVRRRRVGVPVRRVDGHARSGRSGDPDPGWNADNIGPWSARQIFRAGPHRADRRRLRRSGLERLSLGADRGERREREPPLSRSRSRTAGLKWAAPAPFRHQPGGLGNRRRSTSSRTRPRPGTQPFRTRIPRLRLTPAHLDRRRRRARTAQNLVYLGDPVRVRAGDDARDHVREDRLERPRHRGSDIVFNPALPVDHPPPRAPAGTSGRPRSTSSATGSPCATFYGWVPGYPSDAAKAMFGYVGRTW